MTKQVSIPTMLDYVVANAIAVDFSEGYDTGWDQEGMYYPRVFATVRFQLVDTAILCAIAERVCKDEGISFKNDVTQTADVWYQFSIGLNDCTDSKLDTCIMFDVIDADSSYIKEGGVIDLSESEQALIFNRLNEECVSRLNRSCEDLLAEARAKMVE